MPGSVSDRAKTGILWPMLLTEANVSFEAHGDMEPIEDNGRLWQHATLETPKPSSPSDSIVAGVPPRTPARTSA